MDLESLKHHADRVEATIMSHAAANSSLVASWRRSAARHKLDPAEYMPPRRLTEAELREARQSIEPLLRIAQSSLDRLFHAVGGAGCCVLLADRNGVPVDPRGNPADDTTFHSWGFWPGSVWSEYSEGTTGLAHASWSSDLLQSIATAADPMRKLEFVTDQHVDAELGGFLNEASIEISTCRLDHGVENAWSRSSSCTSALRQQRTHAPQQTTALFDHFVGPSEKTVEQHHHHLER